MTATVLIIAGSDPSGGAGIVRDVATVTALGLRACIAVTAVTVQTDRAVRHVEAMPATLIAAQMVLARRISDRSLSSGGVFMRNCTSFTPTGTRRSIQSALSTMR